MGRRRHFSREFKIGAVRMTREGDHTLAEVALDLGIGAGLLGRWRRQLEQQGPSAFADVGSRPVPDEQIRELQRELQRVRQERDILKKALAIFSDRRR